MPNPNNFYLDSDYPMDKIVYFKEGTFTPSAGDVRFSHNLGYRPLLFGVFSKTSDFAVSYSFNVPVVDSVNETGFLDFGAVLLSSDNNNVSFFIPNSVQTGLSGTYYYRIYGFMPNINADSPYTSQSAEKYIINSDYKYYKLYMADEISYTGQSSVTINHNLGFKPYVLVWGDNVALEYFDYPPTMQIINFDIEQGDESGIKINNNSLEISNLSDSRVMGFKKLYYRIYYDEA